jgi:hypothetical protein
LPKYSSVDVHDHGLAVIDAMSDSMSIPEPVVMFLAAEGAWFGFRVARRTAQYGIGCPIKKLIFHVRAPILMDDDEIRFGASGSLSKDTIPVRAQRQWIDSLGWSPRITWTVAVAERVIGRAHVKEASPNTPVPQRRIRANLGISDEDGIFGSPGFPPPEA